MYSVAMMAGRSDSKARELEKGGKSMCLLSCVYCITYSSVLGMIECQAQLEGQEAGEGWGKYVIVILW